MLRIERVAYESMDEWFEMRIDHNLYLPEVVSKSSIFLFMALLIDSMWKARNRFIHEGCEPIKYELSSGQIPRTRSYLR